MLGQVCLMNFSMIFYTFRLITSYAGYVKHVLNTEQKKSDFRPPEEQNADLFSCTQVLLIGDVKREIFMTVCYVSYRPKCLYPS